MNATRSAQLFRESKKFLAGGMSSMLRASSKPLPLFSARSPEADLRTPDSNYQPQLGSEGQADQVHLGRT